MEGADDSPAVTSPSKNPSSFSSSIRFLGFLKQPEPEPDSSSLEELDERDVIWASDLKSDPDSVESDPESEPETQRVTPQQRSAGFGLSAVFAEELSGVTFRCPTRPRTGRIGSGPEILAKSAPVNVPMWRNRRARRWLDEEAALDEVEEDAAAAEEEGDADEDEMVPPHVIVARSHVMTFSVFEGVGRTLKGRDLRRVRNAVFQQTGFLD